MKYIKMFEDFKFGNDLKSLLKTIEDHIDDSFKIKPKLESNKIVISNNDITIEIYDNDKENDFFFIKIIESGKVIQDFERSKSKDGYSPDEIPTENILMIISRYFQNK